MNLLRSDKWHPLICQDEEINGPILTVENYQKWYSLYLIDENRNVTVINDHETKSYSGIAWHDHVPNPDFVIALAKDNGWHIDEVSLEAIVGRYMIEVKNQFNQF